MSISNKIDWYQYHEDFDNVTGYKEYKMLNCYDHYLSNEEAEKIIDYPSVKNGDIKLNDYLIFQSRVESFFEKLFDLKNIFVFNPKSKSLLKRNKVRYMNYVRSACQETKEFIFVLPDEKIVIESTYDLMFVVIFYSDVPNWINELTEVSGLFLLSGKKRSG